LSGYTEYFPAAFSKVHFFMGCTYTGAKMSKTTPYILGKEAEQQRKWTEKGDEHFRCHDLAVQCTAKS
jgi:hypothetical protein